MECSICKITDTGVCDGLCDSCESKFINEISNEVHSMPGETPVHELFYHVSKVWIDQHELSLKLLPVSTQEQGTVPVYKYEFSQDVKYLRLGEFMMNDVYYTVICTLESGKGAMRRIGLHYISAHNELSITDALLIDDAKEIVRTSIETFGKEMKNTPAWKNTELASEMYRVGNDFIV